MCQLVEGLLDIGHFVRQYRVHSGQLLWPWVTFRPQNLQKEGAVT